MISRRDDLKVAFADVLEGAAVGQVKIVEMLAAKGAADHLAPMTLVPNRCPQFQHTLPTPQRQTRFSSLIFYAARPPATATLNTVDMMPTGIDRLTAAPKANPLKPYACYKMSHLRGQTTTPNVRTIHAVKPTNATSTHDSTPRPRMMSTCKDIFLSIYLAEVDLGLQGG
jgi:hypothetical protein